MSGVGVVLDEVLAPCVLVLAFHVVFVAEAAGELAQRIHEHVVLVRATTRRLALQYAVSSRNLLDN